MSNTRRLLHLLCIFLTIAFFAGGCTETKEDLIVKGNLDLWQRHPDEAIRKFKKVLEMDPKNADAHRGMANAYNLKQDIENRELFLLKAYQLHDLRAKDKDFFAEQLNKLYLEKAASCEGNDTDYESALLNALKYNEKSKAPAILAKFYLEKGNKLVEKQHLQEAIQMFQRVLDLKLESSKFAAQAESARDLARLTLLTSSYGSTFATRKEQLASEGRFDPPRNRWVASFIVTMPPDVEPDDQQLDEKAAAIGSHQGFVEILKILATEAATTVPEPLPQMEFSSWTMDKAAWVRKPKEFSVTVSISYDDGLKAMYFLQKIAESRKAGSPGGEGTGEQQGGAAPAPAGDTAAPAPAPAPTGEQQGAAGAPATLAPTETAPSAGQTP